MVHDKYACHHKVDKRSTAHLAKNNSFYTMNPGGIMYREKNNPRPKIPGLKFEWWITQVKTCATLTN